MRRTTKWGGECITLIITAKVTKSLGGGGQNKTKNSVRLNIVKRLILENMGILQSLRFLTNNLSTAAILN